MAVRSFDLTEPQTGRLKVLEPAPRRHDLRRQKRRYATLGVAVVALPFFGALIALGVAH